MTNFDILSMVIKHIRGGIFYAIHQYAKADNKYIKNHDENKESSQYWDVSNLDGWTMSQKLPSSGLKKHLNLIKISRKAIKMKVMKDIF